MKSVIEVLAAGKGHEDLVLPENGAEAKVKVDELLKKGYLITVKQGDADLKVTAFDGEKNEYIAESKENVRIAAAGAKVTAVAPVAGG